MNAYTLTFAVLLLTGAALGDRFGRRRMFAIGLGDLHARLRSCGARALDRHARRRARGAGARRRDRDAADADDPLRGRAAGAARRLALGAWGGISGLAVAFGPLVGGAVVSGISWHWIFWLNVPIGLVLAPLALMPARQESYGPASRLDLPGVGLASAGLFGIVWGLVRGNSVGWSSPEIVGALVGGAVLLGAFVWWELRTAAPMLPMRFFRNRTFALANVSSPAACSSGCSARSSCSRSSSRRCRATRRSVRAAHPAVDGDADHRRADRRRALRPDRRPRS